MQRRQLSRAARVGPVAMSHALGVLCEAHAWVMAPDACPECEDRHGYTTAPCDERCPENVGYDIYKT